MAGRDTLIRESNELLNDAHNRINSIRGTIEAGDAAQARGHVDAIKVALDQTVEKISHIEKGDRG